MKYKLGDIATFSQGKQIEIDEQFLKKDENHSIRFIRIVDYTNPEEPIRYVKNYGERYYATENEVIMIRYGSQTAGKVVMGKNGIIANNMFKMNFDNSIIKNKYAYYYLSQDRIFNYLRSSQSSSTMPAISFGMLNDFVIDIPEIKTQEKVIALLDIIDKKINYNTHTNNNLYEIGKALYQEYFESEKYTNNYEIKQLSEVTTNNRNKIDQAKEYKVLSAVNTGNLVLSDDYFDKQVYSKDIGKYLNVNKNDFAYNPARINIGSIGLNTFDFNCCVSPVYVTFSVDIDYIDFFNFYFKSKKFNAEVTLRASGSVRQALNYNDFGMIEIPYPTKEMIDKFNSSYKTIKDRINKNKAKIRNLEQIRDTLLPKLMNGEIDLDKIEI